MHPDVIPQALIFKQVTLDGIGEVAKKLVETMGAIRVCALEGEMGAGKTTLVRAIGHVLEVSDAMSSPTFSIVNEYHTAGGGTVYHFDFYRVKNEAEAYDVGAEEYFYSGNYCFIEWPEKIPSLLPEAYAYVKIFVNDSSHRTIEISLHGRKEEKRV
jgi:tRNA threonylcarbamoyladenosine biosynthesis protein TsaE